MVLRKLVKSQYERIGMKYDEQSAKRVNSFSCYLYLHLLIRVIQEWAGWKKPITEHEIQPSPNCPLLFLYGDKKRKQFVIESWLERVQERDNCKVIPVNGFHHLQIENTKLVNDEIMSFITSEF